MRKTLTLTICLGILTMLIGCGSSNPMVGTWKMQFDESLAKSAPAGTLPDVVAEFKADNTFAVNMKTGDKTQTVSGTYELKDKALTMKTTMEDGKPSSDGPETATLSDDMKSFTAPGAAAAMGKMVKQ